MITLNMIYLNLHLRRFHLKDELNAHEINSEYFKYSLYTNSSTQIFFWGVSFIFINPGLVPQPEPYFDLTPIRVTHTKIPLPEDLNLYL